MKGLLIKDFYLCRKILWIYALMIAIFAVAQGQQGVLFSLFYSVTIPINLINYDEGDRFDRLQTVLPLSWTARVLDKYVCAWATIAVVTVCYGVRGLLPGGGDVKIAALLFSVAAVLTVQAIMLPMLFRFGTERGRTLCFIAVFALAVLLGALGDMWDHVTLSSPSLAVEAAMLLLAALASAASVALSAKVYERRCTA